MWPYPIFVINMKQHAERREAAIAELAKVGLTATIFEAVNGRELPPGEVALQDLPGRLVRAPKPLTPAEMGCYLSHWRVLEKMVAEDIPQALILEDDFIATEELPGVLEALAHGDLPPYDMIKLAISEIGLSGPYEEIVPLTPNANLVRHHRVVNSNLAYVITRAGAQRFLGYGMPIRYPVDVAMNRSWRHGLDILAVRPWPVLQNEALESVIGGERFKNERKDKGPLLRQVERRLRKAYDSFAKRADLGRRFKQDAEWKKRQAPSQP